MYWTPTLLALLLTLNPTPFGASPQVVEESSSVALPAPGSQDPSQDPAGKPDPGGTDPAGKQSPPGKQAAPVGTKTPASVADPTPPRDPSGATESKPARSADEVAPVRERYQFTTFGGSLLEDAPLVVDGAVKSVNVGGKTVVVARVVVKARLQMLADSLEASSREGASVTVLATPGELVEGQRYLLFLRPFGKSQRYSVLRRIAEGDRDFAPKRRVLEQFAALNSIEDTTGRALAIRDALLDNLTDEVLFVRWNAHAELTQFIPRHRQLFGRVERARLADAYRTADSPTYRRAVDELLKAVGVDLDGAGGGPR